MLPCVLCFRNTLFFDESTVDILLDADAPDLSLDQKRTTDDLTLKQLFVFGPRTWNKLPESFSDFAIEIEIQQGDCKPLKRGQDDVKKEVDGLKRLGKLSILFRQHSAEINEKKNALKILILFKYEFRT